MKKKIIQLEEGDKFEDFNEETQRLQEYIIRKILPNKVSDHFITFEVTTEGGTKTLSFLKRSTVNLVKPEVVPDLLPNVTIQTYPRSEMYGPKGKRRSID